MQRNRSYRTQTEFASDPAKENANATLRDTNENSDCLERERSDSGASEANAGKTGEGRSSARGRGDAIPCSLHEGASLAPSHNSCPPSQRSVGQGGSREAPPHKAEGRGGGDGSPLTGARTEAPCDGRGAGFLLGLLPGAVTPGRNDGDGEVSGNDRAPRAAVAGARGVRGRAPDVSRVPVGRLPGRVGSGGAKAPVLGTVPESDGGAKVLRSALDWFTVLSLLPVSWERWAELGAMADNGVAELLPSSVGSLPVEVRRLGRDLVCRSVAGLYVMLREPSRCRVAGAPCARSAELTPDPCTRLVRYGERVCQDAGALCRLRGVEGRAGGLRVLVGVEVEAFRTGARVGPSSGSRCDGGTLGVTELASALGADHRNVYGVELQIQGTAFSSVGSGGDELVREVWRVVAGWLFRDRGWSDVVARLDPWTRVGRCDVAFDVAFEDDAHGRFVQWGIYGDGSHDVAFRRWSTRAGTIRSEETVSRPPGREGDLVGRRTLLGKETAGRTAYLGSGEYVLLCLYERSKKTDGDWSVLGPTLERAGWDGVSEVVRAEFRWSRRWLNDQVLRDTNGKPLFPRANPERGDSDGRRCAELTVSEFLRALPLLVVELPGRFRHTDPFEDRPGAPRKRDRASAAWWVEVETAARAWRSGSGDLGRVVSTRRLASASRTVTALRSGFVRLVALRGGRSLSDVLPEVFEAWDEKGFREHRERLMAKVRDRYAMPPPPRASSLHSVDAVA